MYTFLDILSSIFYILGFCGILGFIGAFFNKDRYADGIRMLSLIIVIIFFSLNFGTEAIIKRVCDNVNEKENMIDTLQVTYIGEDLGKELYETSDGNYYVFTEVEIPKNEKRKDGPKYEYKEVSENEANFILTKIAAKKKD